MRMTRAFFLATVAVTILHAVPSAAAAQTRLLREPSISERHIAFSYANNIWVVGRAGGDARRLTSFQGQETNPKLSPDGRWVAFSAQYGGNTDVYVVPVEGGEPRRLTWHPGSDVVQGWTPDGGRVVFSSSRTSAPAGTPNFWSVSLEGDFPQPLPMPRAYQGKYSPDGGRFAYRMASSWDDEWRNYRGGQNRPIWILDLQSHELETPPWDGSKDIDPVWIGDVVYFLSDRDWVNNVWSYDTRSRRLAQVTNFRDFDVKTLDAGAGVLVFDQAGWLHTHDPRTGRTERLEITVRGDFPWLMPRWQDAAPRILNAAISPTGRRAVFEARGEIFTVPAEHGDWRNLTNSPGVAERNPQWSPDGRTIAYFSDHRGEYRLMLAPQDGAGAVREIELPEPSFVFTPQWSPDSRRLLYTDTHLQLWLVDIESGRVRRLDHDNYMVPERSMNPVWSPDSRYIAYTKRLDNLLRTIFIYSLDEDRSRQVTDGMADATWPAWDRSGRYLYFLASTNFGLNTGWLDMTSYDRPVTRSLYAMVLRRGEPSPLLPRSDEEGSAGAQPARDAQRGAGSEAGGRGGQEPAGADAAPRAAARVQIDFDGLMDRVVPLGVTPRNYSQLRAGPAGTLFFLEPVPASGPGGAAGGPGSGSQLHRFVMNDREARPFLSGVQSYTVSADGQKLLVRAGQTNWRIINSTGAAPTGTTGSLNVAALRMRVDPRAEYRQMFDEGWRHQRDFLYVDNLHGADYERTKAQYAPLLEHVAHRADFTWLLDMLGAEVAVGHSYVRGGDVPDVPSVNVGMLGADLEVADGRYRITKIYTGESWNPQARAPLAQPGIDVAVGDYILAVNGVELTAARSIYELFENTANRQTSITVNSRPTLAGARRVTVVPVASEGQLRQADWVESNRRLVDELSGGRLAYVWVPNTGTGGYASFNRYYFAQQDRQGAIIDERFNGGGSAADYIIEVLARDFDGYFNNRIGARRPFTSPAAGIWGPKVMIINEMAGSGGDLLPFMFRYRNLGPLVGTRTWGGLVGTWDTPPLLDGGTMIAPRGGFLNRQGEWAVENEGVAPDIEVEMTPREVIAGRDPQLERAVQEALRLLDANPPVRLEREPAPPVRHRRH
jgi:tricorn protease